MMTGFQVGLRQALCLMLISPLALAQWSAEEIVSGLDVPWGMAQVDDQHILITQRSGDVGMVNVATKQYTPLYRHDQVFTGGQGGLLDIARSPFNTNYYYFTYSKKTKQGVETTLAIGQLQANQFRQVTDVFVTQSQSNSGRHYGSRISFDNKHIYFSIGDRGTRDNGQNRTNHAGTILRLNPDGSIPADNPFVDQIDYKSAIWSYGHRNPQGLYFDSELNRLWSVEHGPRGGDEINIITKGANYGWPITSHGEEYWAPIAVGEAKEKAGITSPTKVYIPSIAPSSLIVYRQNYYPELKNSLLIGALKLTHINVLKLDEQGNIVDEQRILESLGERIRDIEAMKSGEIYFSTDSGKIFKLTKSD